MITLLSLTVGREIYQDAEPNLLSFSITHFSGYLFFLVMPVEGLYIYYLSMDLGPFWLTVLAMATALSAQALDYLCGYVISDRAVKYFVRKDRFERFKRYIRQYGNAPILFFNLLPLSSPILVLAAGILKYPFRKVFFYSFLGLLIKYGLVALGFLYFFGGK